MIASEVAAPIRNECVVYALTCQPKKDAVFFLGLPEIDSAKEALHFCEQTKGPLKMAGQRGNLTCSELGRFLCFEDEV